MPKSPFIFALLLTATTAIAQQGNPGGHFVENWDLDGDGKVTLEEATERRSDVFFTFDADEDGILSPEEYDLFDEAREIDMAQNGVSHDTGKRNPANGMLREVTDANGDGNVTRDEFMDAVPMWFANMDRNKDNVVTTADFGRS